MSSTQMDCPREGPADGGESLTPVSMAGVCSMEYGGATRHFHQAMKKGPLSQVPGTRLLVLRASARMRKKKLGSCQTQNHNEAAEFCDEKSICNLVKSTKAAIVDPMAKAIITVSSDEDDNERRQIGKKRYRENTPPQPGFSTKKRRRRRSSQITPNATAASNDPKDINESKDSGKQLATLIVSLCGKIDTLGKVVADLYNPRKDLKETTQALVNTARKIRHDKHLDSLQNMVRGKVTKNMIL
ncbi:hypothetical protein ABEB36_015839 [Hypothenemus hampei]|uniref:Uncharacterized protein n=1 Tax=Hypothenemus hampei TaxID=57062 RepID=A0ABD1DYM2_HYPHA